MNNLITIQDELNALNSHLPFEKSEIYTVPQGYFENFAASVLQRLNSNSTSAVEELENLSPILAGISKKMPFMIPEGYFNAAAEDVSEWVKEEEIPEFLKAGKRMPYEVPVGYFENLPGVLLKKISPKEAKVISISASRRWMRYAVAAMVAGVIAVSSVLYFGKDKSVDPTSDSYSWVEKNLKNISDKELEEFINTTYISTTPIAKNQTSDKSEVRKLVKDIPNAELDKFLEEVTIDTGDVLLVN
jgi:hypothetical protein